MREGIGRRRFVAAAALGAASVAAGAARADAPEVAWRLASSFPKSLDLLFGGAETFVRQVGAATGGRFRIDVFPPGDVAPAAGVLDAVGSGAVDACQTSLDYFYGKDPAFALPTAFPFGMNAREQIAYALQGGGLDLTNALLAEHGAIGYPAGNTGAQMGGFFKREIKSAADLSGLKIRAGGLAGRVLQKLGAVPVQTARGDIVAALNSGALDGVTWVGPYDDAKLDADGKLQRAAPYYYYPGWWRGGSMVHVVFNKAKHDALPDAFKAALRTAALSTYTQVLASYDAANPGALKKIVISGAELRAFPQDLLEAAYRAANDVYRDISSANPRFKAMIDAATAFRADQYLWWQVSEYTFDNFMIRQRARG
jgi:TRAP-type mannitol/chloroaromatic compound transport system substrate-binding protein